MSLPFSQRITMQNAAVATGNGTAISVADSATLGMQVSGTFVGTVTFEATIDNTNWKAVQVVNLNDGSVATTATAAGVFAIGVAGLNQVRARVSAWTSGSITVVGFSTTASSGLSLADIDVATPETVVLGTGTASIGKLGANSGVNIGDVGIVAEGGTISQTPTVTAGAYSAGDNVGGLLTFADAARVSGGGGVIKDVLLIDDAGQDAELELWLFKETFTPGSDNDAWAPVEAELHNLITVISTTDGHWIAAGTPSVCPIEIARRYDLTGTSLFGRLVTRGTPTFAATDDVTVMVGLLQD